MWHPIRLRPAVRIKTGHTSHQQGPQGSIMTPSHHHWPRGIIMDPKSSTWLQDPTVVAVHRNILIRTSLTCTRPIKMWRANTQFPKRDSLQCDWRGTCIPQIYLAIGYKRLVCHEAAPRIIKNFPPSSPWLRSLFVHVLKSDNNQVCTQFR